MLKLFEEYKTSVFKVKNNYFTLYIKDKIPTEVYIIMDDDYYDSLSVIIPDSNNLRKEEFFINPNLDNEFITTLEEQNFISETGKTAVAGNKKVKSYMLV